MEISNGIRGLRFHRDQSSSCASSQHESASKGCPSDEGKSGTTRTNKSTAHKEESAVSSAVSRLFPVKSASPPLTRKEVSSRTSEAKCVPTSQSLPSSLTKTPSPLTSSCALTTQSSSSSAADQTFKQQNGNSPPGSNDKHRRPSKESILNQTKLIGSPKAGIANRIRKLNMSVTGQKWAGKPETILELMIDEGFLSRFFFYFSSDERRKLCQVCKKWKSVLYQSVYWVGVMPVINFKDWGSDVSKRKLCFENFQTRGFDQVCFVGAVDKDITDFTNNIPSSKKLIRSVSIRCSNTSDNALESIIRKMPNISRLELSNCNEVTGSGLWACLNPKIVVLTITDCIHIADDTIGAIAQLLPALHELNLQAYHVTDNGLALFDSKLNSSLRILRLKSCWEITNHGVVNIIHALPNITVLSLSGCSKITDDGVEIIAENMKKLKSLDISWCSRVTDASLEYVACDLGVLEELVLDR